MDAPTSPAQNSRVAGVTLFVLFTAGVAVSLLAFFEIRRLERANQAGRFRAHAAHQIALVQARVEALMRDLAGETRAWKLSEAFPLTPYKTWARSAFFQHPSLRALAWCPRVRQADRDTWEKDHLFILGPPGFRSDYVPIYHLEQPVDEGWKLGVDLLAVAGCKEALMLARDTGLISVSGRLRLSSQPDAPWLGMLAQPLYLPGPLLSEEDRRERLVGFLVALVSFRELVDPRDAPKNIDPLELSLWDESASFEQRALQVAGKLPPHATLADFPGVTLDVGGRRWLIEAQPSPAFWNLPASHLPWWILGLGIGLTLLLVGFLRFAWQTQTHLESLLAERNFEINALHFRNERDRRTFPNANREIETLQARLAEQEADLNGLRAKSDQREKDRRARAAFLAQAGRKLAYGWSELRGRLERTLAGELPDEQRRSLRTLQGEFESLAGAFDNLFDLFLVEADQLAVQPAPFSLRAELHEVTQSLAPVALEKNLALGCRVQPEVPDALLGDARRLRQILRELLENALDVTQRGEIAVAVEVESLSEREATLSFRVTDTGPGIPPELAKELFEPFAAGGASYRLGLGLALSQRLAESLGGRLWFETSQSETAFHLCVTFPRG